MPRRLCNGRIDRTIDRRASKPPRSSGVHSLSRRDSTAEICAERVMRPTSRRNAKLSDYHTGARKWGLAPSTMGMAAVIQCADGACPLFRAATPGHRGKGVEKGDRHRAGEISSGFSICSCSEPVPLFHYTKPTLQFSWTDPGDTQCLTPCYNCMGEVGSRRSRSRFRPTMTQPA